MINTYHFIDLTHSLKPEIPTWNGSCGFRHEIKIDYAQGLRVQSIKMHAGVGTHMDAPSHFFKDASFIADLPLEQLIVPAVVINVSSKVHGDYFISDQDIQNFEKNHGIIPANSLVIGYTGWSKFWDNTTQYRNEDANGLMHFPGFHPDAIKLLLERDVAGVAIDTLSPDGSNQDDFPVHKLMLGAGKYIIENITNVHLLPPAGAYVIALPLKTESGTESAIRMVGLVEKTGFSGFPPSRE